MILFGDAHVSAAACFVELNAAVEAMTWRPVAFNCHNAHGRKIPPHAIVYNLESIPVQADPTQWEGHEVWDSIESNLSKYPAGMNVKHVPVGYHPSMERFTRAKELDIDVVFTGAVNLRRKAILDQLFARGLKVVVLGPAPGNHGAARDAVLARARLAVNILARSSAPFPAVRCAHLVANRVPVVSEWSADAWPFLQTGHDMPIVEHVTEILSQSVQERMEQADHDYEAFKAMPMMLP